MNILITCGIAGIGHLGEALTKQLEGVGVNIHAFHPHLQKRTKFASKFENVKAVDFSDLFKQPIVLLALPADEIKPFLRDAQKEVLPTNVSPVFVSLSTLIDTKELKNEFSNFQIYGVKMIGHANFLYEYGDGIFLTETQLDTKGFEEVRFLFEKIGELFEDNEDIVREINGLAVRRIIEACMNFEKETNNYPNKYSKKAMDTIFPNTMRLYRDGSFDGHMQSVMDEIKLTNENKRTV